MNFEGKTVLVTGAGLGIGRTAALLFAHRGARVCVADVDEKHGAETVAQILQESGEAFYCRVDVAAAGQVKKMVQAVIDRWGKLNILVNNAGIYRQGGALAVSEADWDRVMEVNLKGVFLCSREACRVMKNNNQGGVIVNVSSEAGLVGIKGQVAYNVSKGGVIALTRSMAVDFAPGIRVNCICPGTTETPLVRDALSRAEDPESARKALEGSRPLNRLGTPEEIATGILFLACDEAAYATGTVLSIDGGLTAW